jgi:serine/threonine-protein kinase
MASRTVAVLPFAIDGNADLEYLREGFADLLSAKLDGAGELRSVDPNAVLVATSRDSSFDSSSAALIARRFGAGLFVLGRVIDANGRLHAKASLYDVEGHVHGVAEAAVDDERLVFDLIDEIARRLLALSPVQAPERLARVGALMTESFAAIKSYLEGERLQRSGRYDEAVGAYERAVAADSTFALAYYRMAVAQHHDATPSGRANSHRAALSLAERLPRRDRMLVEGFDSFQHHRDREAERVYRELLSLHPDEIDAWFFLGQVIEYYGLWRGRPISDARTAFERVLALDSSHVGALAHLAWIAAMEENFEEGAAIANRMLALQPDGYFAPALRLHISLARRDRAGEQAALAELRVMDSDYLNRAQRWAHFSGNLEGRQRAARLLTEATRPARWRRLGHVVAARYEVDRGRWGAAYAELDRAKGIDPDGYMLNRARLHLRPLAPTTGAELAALGLELQRWGPAAPNDSAGRAYLLGLVRARQRDSIGALRLADELDARASRFGPGVEDQRSASRARDLAHGVRAWLAAEAGRPAEAMHHLDRLEPDRWWLRGEMGGLGVDAIQPWLRAEVLAALGRDDEALLLYAPLGWLWGDVGLLAPKHLHTAELYERRGDRDKAKYHYLRFIELWKDCDPELQPIVRDVRSRLERL